MKSICESNLLTYAHTLIILGLPTKDLRKVLEPYGYEYAFTDSLLSDACAKAKLDLFGSPSDNVKYAHRVFTKMVRMGHFVQFTYSKRSKVISKLGHVVIAEEIFRRKLDGEEALAANDCSKFVEEWKQNNASEIANQLGVKDGPQLQFLFGIIFAPATSKDTVPLLQNISLPSYIFLYLSFVSKQFKCCFNRLSKPTRCT